MKSGPIKIKIIGYEPEPKSVRGLSNKFNQYLNRNSLKYFYDVSYISGVKTITNKLIKKIHNILSRNLTASYIIFCFNTFIKLLTEKKYNLIVINDLALLGFLMVILSKIKHNKLMLTVHGIYSDEWTEDNTVYGKFKRFVFEYTSKVIINNADLIISNDKKLANNIKNHNKKGDKNIWLRYVNVDMDNFCRSSLKKEDLNQFKEKYNLPDKYVLYIGNLEVRDGIEQCLTVTKELLKENINCNFVIVGEGCYKKQVSELAGKYPINVRVINEIPFQNIKYVYFYANSVFLPMNPPQSGVGKITLEALSMECPVITTNVGMLDEIVKNDIGGFITEYRDTNSMISHIKYLYTNEAIARQFGKNGRKRIAGKYDQKTYIENWLKSIEYLIDTT